MENVQDSDKEEKSAQIHYDMTFYIIFWFLLPLWPRLLPPPASHFVPQKHRTT